MSVKDIVGGTRIETGIGCEGATNKRGLLGTRSGGDLFEHQIPNSRDQTTRL